MGYGCYEKYGAPKIVNDRTLAAAEKINKVYEFSCVGGNAHIVVDDWNLEDNHIQWCLTEGMKSNVHEADAEQLQAERECLNALLALNDDERASAMAIHEGWLVD